MATILVPALDTPLCIPALGPRRRDAALLELARAAARAGHVLDADGLHASLMSRERLACTSPGRGLALPNVRSIQVIEPRLIVARSPRGIDWLSPDGEPVHLVVMALSPAEATLDAHRALLARAYAGVRLVRMRQRLLDAADVATLARRWAEAAA
jgi:mannitol/fructose-specific phosphotransferase system IIA component (Ntr-type)